MFCQKTESPSWTTTPVLRPLQSDFEGGRKRGVLLYWWIWYISIQDFQWNINDEWSFSMCWQKRSTPIQCNDEWSFSMCWWIWSTPIQCNDEWSFSMCWWKRSTPIQCSWWKFKINFSSQIDGSRDIVSDPIVMDIGTLGICTCDRYLRRSDMTTNDAP